MKPSWNLCNSLSYSFDFPFRYQIPKHNPQNVYPLEKPVVVKRLGGNSWPKLTKGILHTVWCQAQQKTWIYKKGSHAWPMWKSSPQKAVLVNERREVVVYLNFIKASNIVSCSIQYRQAKKINVGQVPNEMD